MTKSKKALSAVTPAALTLEQIMAHFNTPDAAREYLEAIRWPDGPFCPHCGNCDSSRISTIAANPKAKVRAGLRECRECRKQFTVTVGTIFEDSHIPLNKWLIAWYTLCASKKGISALQMQRMLDLGSYRSAWHMMHRIRFALRSPVFGGELGSGGGTVEVDKAYVGGKPRNIRPNVLLHGKPARMRGPAPDSQDRKAPVVSIVERGGRVRSFSAQRITGKALKSAIRAHVNTSACICTDERRGYTGIRRDFAGGHHTVNHSRKEYVRGDITTDTVESYFSLFKRGVSGVFHHIGALYMDQYLTEFDFRYKHRDVTDGERTVAALERVTGKRLMLRRSKKRQ